MSEISIEKAEVYLEAQELIKALSVLKIILKNEPDKIEAIRMSVKIYTKLAKYEKAIKILHFYLVFLFAILLKKISVYLTIPLDLKFFKRLLTLLQLLIFPY